MQPAGVLKRTTDIGRTSPTHTEVHMRALQVLGIVLIVAGLWVLVHPPTYTREESLFKVGNVEATMRQQHPVPAWAGGAALGAGVVILLLGLVRR
jgi:hypothetical protein